MNPSILSVQCPGNSLLRGNCQSLRLKAVHALCTDVTIDQSCHNLIYFHGRTGFLNQGYLEFTIIELYILAGDILKAAYRHRICHHSVQKASLYREVFTFDFQIISLNVRKTLHSFQQVSHMSEDIFHILPRCIGNLGKQTKCRNIDKIIFVECPHITGKPAAVHNGGGCCFHSPRNSKT